MPWVIESIKEAEKLPLQSQIFSRNRPKVSSLLAKLARFRLTRLGSKKIASLDQDVFF